MRKGFLTFAAVGLLATGSMAACGDDSTSDDTGGSAAKKPKIGVILPDSKSSARWETADRRFLKEAFEGGRRRVATSRTPRTTRTPSRPSPTR